MLPCTAPPPPRPLPFRRGGPIQFKDLLPEVLLMVADDLGEVAGPREGGALASIERADATVHRAA